MRPVPLLAGVLLLTVTLAGCTSPEWLTGARVDDVPAAFPPALPPRAEAEPSPEAKEILTLTDPVLDRLPWAAIVNATDPLGLGNSFHELGRPEMRAWAAATYPLHATDPDTPPFPGYGHPDHNARGHRVAAGFMNRDGTRLDGTLYFPPNATPADGPFPGILFLEGLHGATSMYQWWHLAFAERGYIVFAFDFPGQGESDGEARSPRETWAPDALDALDHLLTESPAAPFLDPGRLGVIGHSKGAITTLEMLNEDPRIPVAIANAPIHHTAAPAYNGTRTPLMVQSGDHDGPIAPIPFAAPLFARGVYDMALGDRMLLHFEAGTHGCHTNYPFVPMPTWCNPIADHYATAWLDAHLNGGPLEPLKEPVPHLSALHRSEYDLAGERGTLAGALPPRADAPPLGGILEAEGQLAEWRLDGTPPHRHRAPPRPPRHQMGRHLHPRARRRRMAHRGRRRARRRVPGAAASVAVSCRFQVR